MIFDSNPSDAIYHHKNEDIIVGATPVLLVSTVPISGALAVPVNTESQMYNMLFGSSVTFLLPELFMKENTSLKGRNALQLGFFNAIWEIL